MGRKRLCGTRATKRDCDLHRRKTSHPEMPSPCSTANDRERARMRVLSSAFKRLKDTLPWVPADTKLSKLDTLRMACYYIDHLDKVLGNGNVTKGGDRCREEDEDDEDIIGRESNSLVEPVNLTWPFGFTSHLPAREMRTRGELRRSRCRCASVDDDSE